VLITKCLWTCTKAMQVCAGTHTKNVHAHAHAYKRAYVCECACTHPQTNTHTHTHTHTQIHRHTHIHTHAHTHAHAPELVSSLMTHPYCTVCSSSFIFMHFATLHLATGAWSDTRPLAQHCLQWGHGCGPWGGGNHLVWRPGLFGCS
jgi:hypothetical protein